MTSFTHDIFLDDKIIGTTELKKADAPTGVVFGVPGKTGDLLSLASY